MRRSIDNSARNLTSLDEDEEEALKVLPREEKV
jgi:hypothetical protein